jgi:aminoglycoside 3-N-acetyltransferase
MHYLEWVAKVPYRYNREFTGKISHNGKTYEDTYKLFVRYNNVKPNTASYTYEKLLEERGLLRVTPFGDNSIRCMSEQDARAVYLELLQNTPNYFIVNPFRQEHADDTFVTKNMVAL